MQTLQTALAGLAQWPRFFVWRLTDWNGKKFDTKHPWGADYKRFDAKLACLQNQLLPYGDALALLESHRSIEHNPNVQYSLGWYFMADTGYWFLDIDGCVTWPEGLGVGAPVWNETAHAALAHLGNTGCFFEYSSSMQGVHFIGRGNLGQHKTRGKGMPDAIEIYSKERGICFGLYGSAMGNADVACTPPPAWIVENDQSDADEIGGDRMPEWRGPEDDDELIARMLKRSEAANMLRGTITLRQLWEGDEHALAKQWPHETIAKGRKSCTEADGALAMQLAWWTGCDTNRMMRLMWRSGLVREKWSDPHHRTYLEITVRTACTALLSKGTRSCYVEKVQLPALPALGAVAATSVQAPAPEPVLSAQYLADVEQMRGVPGALELLTRAGNSDELKDAANRIAKMEQWDSADVETISQRLRRKSKELVGDGWPINLCRRMVNGTNDIEADIASGLGKPHWLDDWAFIAAENKYCNIAANFTLLTRDALHVKLFSKPEIPMKQTGDKEDAAKMLNLWGVQVVEALGYNPRAGLVFHKNGQALLNKFHDSMPDFETDYDTEATEIYRQHIWNVAGHNVENYNYLMQWMAHNVQRPGELIRWAVVLIGSRGTGKTFATMPLQAAMGARNVKIASAASVNNGGGFMDWVASEQCLGLISDFALQGPKKYETSEALKPVITDNDVAITRKGKVDMAYTNYANYFMSTNVREPVPLAENDRRWFVLATWWLDNLVATNPAEAMAYFARLDKAVKSLTPGQWRQWFCSIPLEPLPQRAPITVAARSIVANGTSESLQALRELIGDSDIVTTNKLTEALRGIDGAPVKKALTKTMNELGFDYYDKARMTLHGKKVGIYVRISGKFNLDTDWGVLRAAAEQFNAKHDAALFVPGGL